MTVPRERFRVMPANGMVARAQDYENHKAELIRTERMMLRMFGFIVHVEHPHKLVLNHLHILGGGAALMQEAWSLANDR